MLSCKQLVACSSDYLDRQLNLGERLMTRQHLMFCRNCRRFIKQMRLAQATLKAMPQAPEAGAEGLAARLLAERQASR